MNHGPAAIAVCLLFLLTSAAPVSASADGTFYIDDFSDILEIGRSLPSDGSYVQTCDIVFPGGGDAVLDVGEGADVSMGLTVGGETVGEFRVTMNGRSAGSSDGTAVMKGDAHTVNGFAVVTWDGGGRAAVFDVSGPGTYVSDPHGTAGPLAGVFSGRYDGRGHRISGFASFGERAGLFDALVGADIRDLSLDGCAVSLARGEGSEYSRDFVSCAGLLAPTSEDSVLTRVSSVGASVSACDVTYISDKNDINADTVRTSYCGGLVGRSENCDYTACSVRGTAVSAVHSELSNGLPICRAEICRELGEGYRSETFAGGIAGTSRNDDFLFCDVSSRLCALTDDIIDMAHPTSDTPVNISSCVTVGGLSAVARSCRMCGCDMSQVMVRSSVHDVSAGALQTEVYETQFCGGLSGDAGGCRANSCRLSADIGSYDIYGSSPGHTVDRRVGGVYGNMMESTAECCLIDGTFVSGRIGSGNTAEPGWNRGSVIVESTYLRGDDTDGMMVILRQDRRDPAAYVSLISDGLWYWDDSARDAGIRTSFPVTFSTDGTARGHASARIPEGGAVDVHQRYIPFEQSMDTRITSENCTVALTDEGLVLEPVFDWDGMEYLQASVRAEADEDEGIYTVIGWILAAVCVVAGVALAFNIKSLLFV